MLPTDFIPNYELQAVHYLVWNRSVVYYDLPKFGILGLLDALIPKIYLIGWDFLFLTS